MMRIRWLIRRDMPRVLEIEKCSFDYPMDESEIIRLLRQSETIGMVCEDDAEQAIGFMIYSLHKSYLELVDFAVHPNHRLSGVGRMMFDKLASKLAYQRRNRINLLVSEANLGGLNFFKKLGVRAISLVSQPWGQCNHDGIHMTFRVKQEVNA